MNEGRFKSRAKEASIEWASSMSTHGIPSLVRNQRWFLKLVWLVFILVCTGVCAYLVAQSISTYLAFEVYNKYKPVFPQQVPFPTVSICSANQFETNQSFTFVDQVLASNSISDSTDVNFGSESYPTQVSHLEKSYQFVKLVSQVNAMSPNVSDATRKSFGSSLTDFVLACYYGSFPCLASDFTWFYDFNFGNCFKYNGDGSKKFYKPGYLNGLQMVLLTKTDKNINSFAQSLGVRVLIHNHTVNPDLAKGVNIAVGTQANILVSTLFNNQLSFPYNDCYDDLDSADAYDSVLYRTIIGNNQTYRQSDCFNLCYQQRVISACECYDTAFPSLSDPRPCTTLSQINCTVNVYAAFYARSVNEQCGKLCPLECDSVSYSLSFSFSEFPSHNFGEIIMNSSVVRSKFAADEAVLNLTTLKQSVQSVNIYFSQIKYTVIDQGPSMTLIDLIAYIGGTLGLFVGISFLGSIEFVEILLELACITVDEKARGYFRRRRIEPEKTSSNLAVLELTQSDLKVETLA